MYAPPTATRWLPTTRVRWRASTCSRATTVPPAVGVKTDYKKMAKLLKDVSALNGIRLGRYPFTAARCIADHQAAVRVPLVACPPHRQPLLLLLSPPPPAPPCSPASPAKRSGLIGWDEMTMMPEGAAESRATQKAALAGVIHEKATEAELGEVLARLQATNLGELNAFEQVG